MRKILIQIITLVATSYFLNAQNSFIINTTGNTFSPDTLTITVGDTVTWNNTQGFHNINATLATYPSNPEGFGNAVAGAGWSFQWVFTIAGSYDYQCDPHASIGMTGVIIANPFCDPYDLAVNNITATGASLSWTSSNATAFSVKWRIAGSTTSWALSDTNVYQTPGNIFVDTLFFNTLNSNTAYEWRVRPYGCTSTTYWWDGPNFTTINSICNKSLDQQIDGFNPDPVYALWVWSYDTISITNTGNCDLRIRPEFDISHDSLSISASDFDLKWYNPVFGNWPDIPYYIDANGHAVGFWGFGADSTGTQITQGSAQQIIIKIRFRPGANYGTYSANWITQEVDSSGIFLQTLATGDSTSISLIDCSIFNIDSSYSSNISCFNDNNGSASIASIQNGSNEYLYNWNNGDTTSTINNLQEGSYYCIVTDKNWQQCSDSIGFTISEPTELNATENIINVTCYGDSNGVATLNVNGGTSPYTETWNGASQYNLQAGDYYYTLTDSNSCTFSDSVHIYQPSQLNSSISALDITNCGSNDGIINLSVSGGTGMYSYLWSNNDTTEDLNNLSSGTYSVTITDINNCITTNSATINNFNSTLTTSLSSPTYNGYNIQCFGGSNGSISSNTNGGVGSLTYNWSNGQNTAIDTNLSAGLYSLIVTDSLNCTASDSIILSEPNELTSTYTQTNVSCYNTNDGGAIVNFFGGTSGSSAGDTNYILGWAGTPQPIYLPYPQTVFNTSVLPPLYNAIPAGVYPYTVTDLNGCIIYDTITIIEPDSLYITYTLSDNNGYNVSCFGGNNATIDIQVNGGTSPFDNYLNNTLQTGLISNNLSAGNYTDSIVDLNGCNANASITLNQPSQLITTLNTIDISCYDLCDGVIYSNTSGGVIPYNHLWSNNQNTANISNLCTGNYSLILTDENGCIENSSTIINAPNAISVSVDSTSNISNYGGNSGFIYITTNGGSGLLNTNWTSTNNYSSTNNDILNLYAGIYYLEITDTNLCSFLDTFELSQPSSLGISINTITSPSCYDSCNGEINITAYGGDSTYSYLWIGPNGFTSNNNTINNLCNGEYIIIIDDGITNLIDTINIY
ncbi:MAG: plastocyanin/azurin family copper-binding protein, partial [Flavobacteriales bacterium]